MEDVHPRARIRRRWRRACDDQAHLLIGWQWRAFVTRLAGLDHLDEIRTVVAIGVGVVGIRQNDPLNGIRQEVAVGIQGRRRVLATASRNLLGRNNPRNEGRRETSCHQSYDVLGLHQVDVWVALCIEPRGRSVSGSRPDIEPLLQRSGKR